LVAQSVIATGEGISVVNGKEYWESFQDLSYENAIQAKECYRMILVPLYNPYAPSGIGPPERERSNENDNHTVVGLSPTLSAHEYQ
jgi:hypothetical protein